MRTRGRVGTRWKRVRDPHVRDEVPLNSMPTPASGTQLAHGKAVGHTRVTRTAYGRRLGRRGRPAPPQPRKRGGTTSGETKTGLSEPLRTGLPRWNR
ncbi:hypothetical protein BQ8420_15165 [Nocardiopsis sp. JB363]|nr:hypothetical protein BQ8420_15165 [Nocardiopsis sp. JB363]